MNTFNFEKINNHIYSVKTAGTNSIVGEFLKSEDGHFYFILDNYAHGALDANMLREIAIKLDELNSSVSSEIEEYFNT